jgi:Helix-turn-helix domain
VPPTRLRCLRNGNFSNGYSPDRRLNEADLRVAGVLADYFNVRKSKAWPSLSHLAKRTNQSQSTIQRSLARLEKNGIVIKRSGGKGRANEYDLTFADPDPGHSSDYSHSSDQGDRSQLRPGSMVTAVTTHTSYSPEHQAKGGIEVSPASRGAPTTAMAQDQSHDLMAKDLAGEFEQFWQAYPKQEGRSGAKKQFAEVRANGVALATLVAKAKQYAMAKANVDPQWLKTPANWLRDEGWLEDPQPPRARKEKDSDPKKANRKPASAISSAAKTKKAAQDKKRSTESAKARSTESNVVSFSVKKPNFRVGQQVWHTERGIAGEILDTQSVRGSVRVKWTKENGESWLEWVSRPIWTLATCPPSPEIVEQRAAKWERWATFKIGTRVRHKHNYPPDSGRIVMVSEDYPFDVTVEWRDEETNETKFSQHISRDFLIAEESPFKVGALICRRDDDQAQRGKIVKVYENADGQDAKVDVKWRATGKIETLYNPDIWATFLGMAVHHSNAEKESA